MIGREKEIKELNAIYNSGQAEFVAVYGRRRVGKTYLINEMFADKFAFKHTGLSPNLENKKSKTKSQLENFYHSLIVQGITGYKKPKNWLEAFLILKLYLQETNDGSRQIVFLDEMPWMDTPKSGFMQALESFWNSWGCSRHNLMLIVCGSAISWMQDKLIHNHGGLYGRITHQIKLNAFTLKECNEFFSSKGISYSKYDITQAYMVFGGIPYYLNYFQRDYSLSQNIDNLIFAKNAPLGNEYEQLSSSVFSQPEKMKSIIQFLYKRNAGYTRDEISKELNITDGGELTRLLNALISSDFIIKYVPYGIELNKAHYKLIDPFCLFYLHFIYNQPKKSENYWQENITSQAISIWRGFSFENVCFNHIEQIKNAINILGVSSTASAWSKRYDDKEGLQIDLLLSRKDNVINLCEIKFYNDEFEVDSEYYKKMLSRQQKLLETTSKKTSIQSTLITTFGIVHNMYSSVFNNVITLEDLFKI